MKIALSAFQVILLLLVAPPLLLPVPAGPASDSAAASCPPLELLLELELELGLPPDELEDARPEEELDVLGIAPSKTGLPTFVACEQATPTPLQVLAQPRSARPRSSVHRRPCTLCSSLPVATDRHRSL